MQERWNVSSNKEAGNGYSDILVDVKGEVAGL